MLYRACLVLLSVCVCVCVGLDVRKQHKSHTHIICKHVSTHMCFEGTRYVKGQALFGDTRHTEFGRKTGQVSGGGSRLDSGILKPNRTWPLKSERGMNNASGRFNTR